MTGSPAQRDRRVWLMRWLMTLIIIKGRSTKSRAPPISGIRLARRAEHRQPNEKCPRYLLYVPGVTCVRDGTELSLRFSYS